MAVNSNIFSMETTNTETTKELFQQLGGILGVGPREDGRYYLSDLCQAQSVNKSAKYKPERSSVTANLSENSRKNNRYGFEEHGIIAPYSDGINHAEYKYLKPRGIVGDATEWNRIRDFNGYRHDAVAPIKITFPISLIQEELFGVTVDIDNPNTITGWSPNDCVSMVDIVPSANRSCYLALLIQSQGYSFLAPSKVTLAEAAGHTVVLGIAASKEIADTLNSISSDYYSAAVVPLLGEETSENKDFSIVVVLTRMPWREQAYTREEFGDSYSLEYRYGMDRTFQAARTRKSIAGLDGTVTATNWGALQSATGPNISAVKKYYTFTGITSSISITTPAEWYRENIYVEARITNETGIFVDQNGNQINELVFGTTFGPLEPSKTYTRETLFNDLYKYKAAMYYDNIDSFPFSITVNVHRSDGVDYGKESIVLFNEQINLNRA